MKRITISVIVAAFLSIFSTSLLAQISAGGSPLFLQPSFAENHNLNKIKSATLPTINWQKVAEQEAQQPDNQLFAQPVDLDLSLKNSGKWFTKPNGDRVWILKIEAQDGRGIALFYDDFYIPQGAHLFMFDAFGDEIKGAYTYQNNPASGKFLTGFVHSQTVYLEYYEPNFAKGEGRLHIFRADQLFTNDGTEKSVLMDFGFGESTDCHTNINCPEGDDWQDEKRGVCRIMLVVEEGTGWCSGSLINNVENDGTPFVLTGFHCQDGYTPIYDLWRFDFNYESADCDHPSDEPEYRSMLGCEKRAGRQETDFLLVEILDPIPLAYEVYYNGWNRADGAPNSLAMIHHPKADIKKFSLDNQGISIHPNTINWNNEVSTPPNHHFLASLDVGSFEVGSSGSPLFDENGLIVGQLHGGFEGCVSPDIYAGRLFYSWDEGTADSTSLEAWLDPFDTDTMSVEGYQPLAEGMASVSGRIVTEMGDFVAGVKVQVTGGIDTTVVTDFDGFYDIQLPRNMPYTITFEKDTVPDNGVTTFDLVIGKKHILGTEFLDSPYKIIAADMNGNNAFTTYDLVVGRKVILTLNDFFENNTSWRFAPVQFQFTEPTQPFLDSIPNAIVIGNLLDHIEGVHFYGIKTGDLNNTVNPEN